MSQALQDLTAAIDGLIAKETGATAAVAAANAERDKAVAELQATNDALAALTAKVTATP